LYMEKLQQWLRPGVSSVEAYPVEVH
jgi:hypothetical protein